jgi:hypothetical protein
MPANKKTAAADAAGTNSSNSSNDAPAAAARPAARPFSLDEYDWWPMDIDEQLKLQTKKGGGWDAPRMYGPELPGYAWANPLDAE